MNKEKKLAVNKINNNSKLLEFGFTAVITTTKCSPIRNRLKKRCKISYNIIILSFKIPIPTLISQRINIFKTTFVTIILQRTNS